MQKQELENLSPGQYIVSRHDQTDILEITEVNRDTQTISGALVRASQLENGTTYVSDLSKIRRMTFEDVYENYEILALPGVADF